MGFKPGTLLGVKKWNTHGPSYAFLHRITIQNSNQAGTVIIKPEDPPVMYVGMRKSGEHCVYYFLHDKEVFQIILAKCHDIHQYFEIYSVGNQ